MPRGRGGQGLLGRVVTEPGASGGCTGRGVDSGGFFGSGGWGRSYRYLLQL